MVDGVYVYVCDCMNARYVFFILYNTIHERTLISLTFFVPRKAVSVASTEGTANMYFTKRSCIICSSTVMNYQQCFDSITRFRCNYNFTHDH